MPRHSRSLVAVMCAGLLLAISTGLAAASNVETIYLGGMKVMTLRDQGAFPSLTARAVSVDKAITEILSTQDSQHPVVTVKQLRGLWTVHCGNVAVASVYPADAAANRMDPKTQALAWAKTLGQALPRATPCSKLPAGALGPSPAKPAPTKPVPAAPQGPAVAKPAPVAPVKPAPVAEPVAPVAPVAPAPVGVSAPALLVRDAFATVRALPEEDYAAQRDELTSHLLADLTPFITGKVPAAAGVAPQAVPVAPVWAPVETVKPAPAKPVAVKPAPVKPTVPKPVAVRPAAAKPVPAKPTPARPVAVKPAPAKPAPVKPVPPRAVAVKPAPAPPMGGAAVELPGVRAGDPSYAKVPQKNRIREKLEEAREPFLALRQDNPELARQVGDLLAACRGSFAVGKFDESEGYADAALRLLGPR
jgi:hypothetical protein